MRRITTIPLLMVGLFALSTTGCATHVYLESALAPTPGPGNVTAETVPRGQMELGIGGEPLATVITQHERPQEDVPALWMPASTIRSDMTFGLTSWMDLGLRLSVGPGQFAKPNRSWIVPIDEHRAVVGIASKISFRAGNPRTLAFRGALEFGFYSMPTVLYECVECVYEEWDDENDDGHRDANEVEEHVRLPTADDTFHRVSSDNVNLPFLLVSLAASKRVGPAGFIAGCSIRSRYENEGLRITTSVDESLYWDSEHPYVVPYFGVDLYPADFVLLQLQVFAPIDTAYRGSDWFMPGVSGSVRIRFPLRSKRREEFLNLVYGREPLVHHTHRQTH